MVKTVSFKRLILPAVLPQVSLIVVRGPPTFWRSPLSENEGPLRTTLRENETRLFDNRPITSGLDHINENG